ncbi:hypothetical protein [Undibacterium sp. Xuan67W]|uniref:hypothetical protein n=1 Tax=Undibacterium sp. Xuan67W TaxID=3413057 RepID=UPI003BF06BC2
MDEASLAFIKAQQHDASVTKGDPIGFEYQLSFAYRQDWPELGTILDYGLMSISTKERQLVMSKWLSQEDSSFFEKYPVFFAAMCMACTAMFIFLWVAYKKWRSTTAL